MNPKLLTATLLTAPFWLTSAAFAANPNHVERLRSTNQCPNCDLSNADLEDANLFGANLVNANLQGANLNSVNLGSANLTDANLTGATLRNAYLYKATLDSTNFNQADLSNAYLREVTLVNTDLAGATLQGVNLSRVNLVGLDLQDIDLSGANLRYATLSGVNLTTSDPRVMSVMGGYFPLFFSTVLCNESTPPPVDEADSDLDMFGLAFANLQGANLAGANLSHAILVGGDLRNANLSGANLTQTCLTHAKLNNAILDNADLNNAQLLGTNFINASLRGVKNADFSNAYRTLREVRQAQLIPKQSEAKNYVGAMTRAQQAYYLEESKFATEIDELGIGISSETDWYSYEIVPQPDSTESVMMVARAKEDGLKSYTGIVFLIGDVSGDDWSSITQICETEQPSAQPPAMPQLLEDREIQCPAGSVSSN
ncbi:pentapeptide repeat-containing protein [Lusitaniella coriacea LEGE 07157]|uniref:Pentapeptide repeat-containing protein n=1 Tax=Lusitaniella coriacea LEGE 07157 TaxID=945747 RepID=A0A8J7IUW4_9CYAN|nr:pentapeptide repeat-containing protein [Lusitaniella coriacea]MBE9117992.1 pentapeptide repeat-containing protein [Lusitaniella coriacea LEGE 07157]